MRNVNYFLALGILLIILLAKQILWFESIQKATLLLAFTFIVSHFKSPGTMVPPLAPFLYVGYLKRQGFIMTLIYLLEVHQG